MAVPMPVCGKHAVDVVVGEADVDVQARHVEFIGIGRQPDATLVVRQVLAVVLQRIAVGCIRDVESGRLPPA